MEDVRIYDYEFNLLHIEHDIISCNYVSYTHLDVYKRQEYSYAFDLFTENAMHTDIVSITDNEATGTDAVREIIVVDLTKTGTPEGSYEAVKREFSVIPDSEGDSTDAYTYSGSLKVVGERVKGTATSADGWKTLTFAEE